MAIYKDNEINNTLVEETLKSLKTFAAIKSQIDVSSEVIKAIKTIEYLQEQLKLQTALAQNGQSATDTAARLAEELIHCIKIKDKAVETIKDFIKNGCDDPCQLCKYYIECNKEKCDKYSEGVGLTDEKGNTLDWKWSCLDFDYGSCAKLEDTPCYECFKNNMSGFEWKGQN